MATFQKKSFNTPDERRTPPSVTMDIVSFDGLSVARVTYAAGWRWSEHIKPVVGTESCQVPHLAYIISGQIAVQMNDGTRLDFGPAHLIIPPAGHSPHAPAHQPS